MKRKFTKFSSKINLDMHDGIKNGSSNPWERINLLINKLAEDKKGSR